MQQPGFSEEDYKPKLNPEWYLKWGRVDPDEAIKKLAFADLVKLAPTAYTTKAPGEQGWGDVGRFYEVTQDVLLRLSSPYALLPKPLLEEVSLSVGGGGLMVRECFLQLLSLIAPLSAAPASSAASSSSSSPAPGVGPRICVYGNRGCGKTAALLYLLQYVFSRNWLVIATNGYEWPNDKLGLIKESSFAPGIYEQDLFASYFFENLRKTQKRSLKQIKLKRSYPYEWAPRIDPPPKLDHDDELEGEVKEKRLYDMVRLAAIHPPQATEILYDFVEELRLVTEVPVAVSVDAINAWDEQSAFPTPAGSKRVMGTQLSMVDAFSQLRKRPMQRGVFVYSLTSKNTLKAANNYLLDADHTVEVKAYSRAEVKKCVTHYQQAGFLHSIVDEGFVSRVKALSGGVPTDVRKLALLL